MRKFGYQPTVLSVKNASVPLEDLTLLKEIPEGVVIERARTLEPSYKTKDAVLRSNNKVGRGFARKFISNILIPDPQILWLPGLIKKAFSLRKKTIDLIFVTAPPFSSLVACVIIKYILEKPLVVDFRDEWVDFLAGASWSDRGKNKWISYPIERFMEKIVIKFSSSIVCASPGYVEGFKRKYPKYTRKFTTITNGYDRDDLGSIRIKENQKKIIKKDKFNIVYMGTVWSATTLQYFFEGINEMESKKDVNIIIVGRIVPDEEYVVAAHKDLEITGLGYCDHKDALALASMADALLVTLSPFEGTDRIIPAKIFEYIALKKHIIAIVPNGSTTQILRQYSGSIIVNPAKKTEISNVCDDLVGKWKKGELLPIDEDVSIHSREAKTEALCKVFDRVLNLCEK
ncbi:MAG: glycosyltransferase family 4 protein [Chlorobi bacterium]|nr:glycosyltransferase family 4 protein [Chlorobiota bacterium]